MKISWKIIVISVVIALIPLALYGYFYDQLPEMVATHFDFAGNANGYTSRQSLWLTLSISLIFLPLFVVLPRIDPRGSSYAKMGRFYPAFILGMTIFMAANMSSLVINALPGVHIPIETLIPVAVGILLMVLGNYMPKMKQNYTMGIKTPWTLHSEVVWNKTHRVGGPCLMMGGLLIALSIFAPSGWMLPLVLGITLITVLIPFVMSYVYYKQEQDGQ